MKNNILKKVEFNNNGEIITRNLELDIEKSRKKKNTMVTML